MRKTDGATAPAQKGRRARRGRRTWRMRLLLAGCLFVCLLAAGAAYSLTRINDTLRTVTDDPYKLPNQPASQQVYEKKKPISVLIIGTDTRKQEGMLNTDVLLLAVAEPGTQKVTMVSLPRDTRVQMPGYPGYHKINSVFAAGEGVRLRAEQRGETVTENGISLLKKTVEAMVGIPVQHYILLDFEGFTAVIDKLGGVEVTVDRDLVYELPQGGVYKRLKKGRQVLNGEQALGYVRHRLDRRGHAYDSSDFDRNRRQQDVIKAVADKVTSVDGLKNAFAILETAGKHVKTDLSKEQITGLALDFASFSPERMVSLDNGALWDSRLSYTLWPKEKMDLVRSALQSALGVKTGGTLSDAAVAEYAQAERKAPAAARRQTAGNGPAGDPRQSGATHQTDAPSRPVFNGDQSRPAASGKESAAGAQSTRTDGSPADGPTSGRTGPEAGGHRTGTVGQETPPQPNGKADQQPPADMPPPDILAPPSFEPQPSAAGGEAEGSGAGLH
jgi:polyisoprenyl-teichoic acid--peptidoglycan teichoic acid transferase